MQIGVLKEMRNFCILPTNYNILSTLPQFMTQDDRYGIVEFLETNNYPLIADD